MFEKELKNLSCGSAKSFISDETNKKYYQHFWGDRFWDKEYSRVNVEHGWSECENKLLTILDKVKPLESKSKTEVLKIAQEKLASLTKEEIKEFLIISAVKGSMKFSKDYIWCDVNETKYDVKDVDLDANKKEVSFTYIIDDIITKNYDWEKAEYHVEVRRSLALRFHNFKLKADVLHTTHKTFDNNVLKKEIWRDVYIPIFCLEATERSKIEYIDGSFNVLNINELNENQFRSTVDDSIYLKAEVFAPKYLGDTIGKANIKDKKIWFFPMCCWVYQYKYHNSVNCLEENKWGNLKIHHIKHKKFVDKKAILWRCSLFNNPFHQQPGSSRPPVYMYFNLGYKWFEPKGVIDNKDLEDNNLSEIKETPGIYALGGPVFWDSPIILAQKSDETKIKWDIYLAKEK